MKICILASGSKGNSTYIETKNNKILIDLGTNTKNITEKLRLLEILPTEIDTILITHSHKDHTSAIKTFIKKNKPNIYITYKMLKEIEYLKDYEKTVIFEEDIVLDGCYIESIKTSHDTADSRGYIITEDKKSLVYITDTGYINHKLFSKITNKDVYLVESNHDVEMLINGPYPEWLKKRVYGPSGHLSNQDSANYMSQLIGPSTKKLYLMHLSKENNTEKKALDTMKFALEENNIPLKEVKCAQQDTISEVIEI